MIFFFFVFSHIYLASFLIVTLLNILGFGIKQEFIKRNFVRWMVFWCHV